MIGRRMPYYAKRGIGGIDANTVLMLHGEDFTDSSKNAFIVGNTNCSIVNNGKFQKGIQLKINQYLTLPSNDAFNFAGNNFTIDWWEYDLGTPTMGSIFASCSETGNITGSEFGLIIGYGGTMLFVTTGSSNTWNMFSGTVVKDRTNNAWVHWALVRNGSLWKTYKNGTLFWSGTGSGSISWNTSNRLPRLGTYTLESSEGANCIIDEFRISNVARWTSDFTPPTQPYDEG